MEKKILTAHNNESNTGDDHHEVVNLPLELEAKYIYQNNITNKPSIVPINTKQLCRILCPVGDGVVQSKLITSNSTLFITFDSVTGKYSPKGWDYAYNIPVLREASSSWYYEAEGGSNSVMGPITCRALSKFFNRTDAKEDRLRIRVWSPELAQRNFEGQWKSIADLGKLQVALEAFVDIPPSWRLDDDISKTNDDTNNLSVSLSDASKKKESKDELEDFLSSTTDMGPSNSNQDENIDEVFYNSEDEAYPVTNKKSVKPVVQTVTKKRKKPSFRAKNAKRWIYINGLPKDTDEDEVATYFAKVGILDLDPDTQNPKIKLYRCKNVDKIFPKGDASICYARPESVELAIQILDNSLFRPDCTVSVQRAKFEQHGNEYEQKRKASEVKRKVARLAALQAVGWDEGENGRITGGLKGLRIIVLQGMFSLSELSSSDEDNMMKKLEKEVYSECEKWGDVEKITVFSKNANGVMIVKFSQPAAASDAIKAFHGRKQKGRIINATFWDGVTDYTVRDEEKDKQEGDKRHLEFGNWLECQDVPDEFKLKIEGQ